MLVYPRMRLFTLPPILLAAGVCLGTGAAMPRPDRILAIVGASVIPMDSNRLLHAQTITVRGGVIAAIGPGASVDVPAGAERIDGTGLYLLPGLTDAHVHLRDPIELLSYLAHGVTTVVQLSGPTGNVPDVLELRRRVTRGDVPGPTIYASGRILDGDPAIFPGVSIALRTPREAAAAVEAQREAGVDLVKVYNNLPTSALQAVTRAAHERGLSVWGHVPRSEGRDTALQQALAAGMDVIAHGEEVFFTLLYRDVERQLDGFRVPTVQDDAVREAAGMIREHGAAVIPNLSFIEMTRRQLDNLSQVLADPETRFLHPRTLEMWRQQNPTTRANLARFDRRERGKQPIVRQVTRALQDARVPLLLGSDASASGMFPGKAAHLELSELVKAGLSPYEALAAGTSTSGRFLHGLVRGSPAFGTITVGGRADLLLVEANPLVDIANTARIAGVIVRGEWYPRARLASLREGAARRLAR
jgi:Amidohydrolase family